MVVPVLMFLEAFVGIVLFYELSRGVDLNALPLMSFIMVTVLSGTAVAFVGRNWNYVLGGVGLLVVVGLWLNAGNGIRAQWACQQKNARSIVVIGIGMVCVAYVASWVATVSTIVDGSDVSGVPFLGFLVLVASVIARTYGHALRS